MAYNRVNWEDKPSTATPINADNLNKMDSGIKALEEGKISKSDIVQTDTINDPNKVPSSAVTHALGQQVTTLNNNLANKLPSSDMRSILTGVDWYRVAEYKVDNPIHARGSLCNSVNITIKRDYGSANNEYHNLILMSIYNKSQFVKIGSLANNNAIQKIRHTIDESNNTAYIEIYYSATIGSQNNNVRITLFDTMDVEHTTWEVINPVKTNESVTGVTVMSTLDLTS